MKLNKLEYSYNIEGLPVSIDDAKKGNDYFLDEGGTIKLLVAEGKINVKHYRRHPSTSEDAIKRYCGLSESIEHLNAKRQIKIDGGIEIEGTFIKAHKVVLEVYFKETNNFIDAVLYDALDNVIMGVEIAHTNPKSQDKINQLQLLNINIYEVKTIESKLNIETRPICFSSVFQTYFERIESVRERAEAVRERIRRSEEPISDLEDRVITIERDIKEKVVGIAKGYGEIEERERGVYSEVGREIEAEINEIEISISECDSRTEQSTGRIKVLTERIERIRKKHNIKE